MITTVKFFKDYKEIEIPWNYENQTPNVGDIITTESLGDFDVVKVQTSWIIASEEKLVEVELVRRGSKKNNFFRIP